MPHLLAFDFGLKRIGVAVGNLKSGTSQGIATLTANAGEPNWREIKKLTAEWKPQLFIVGHPVNMDGRESETSTQAKKFADKLQTTCAIKTDLVDERLTTIEADHLLKQTAAGKTVTVKRKKHRDQLAAQLIAQTYLNDRPK